MNSSTINQYLKYGLVPLILVSMALALTLNILIVSAQTPPEVEVEFYIESQTKNPDMSRTVGDQLTLRLEVVHSDEARVSLPQVGREWGRFHVIEQSAPETVNHGDGSAKTSKNIIVTLFEPGFYKTPNLVITHRRADGAIEDYASPVVQLRVISVITDEDEAELKELKGQVNLPVPLIWPWVLSAILLGVVLVFVAIWTIWWLYLRQRKPIEESEPVPEVVVDPRPPEMIAYAELDRITQLNLPEQEKVKEHYSLVSDCMREYAENRYDVPALEQTTYEFNQAMRKKPISTGHVNDFMSLLNESDLVKFAKHHPQDDETNGLVTKARSVVAITTPKESLNPTDSLPNLEKPS
ncbi:hypothetical protein QUF58_14435 [Anaerolineales bacterium HSG24]|nr:hypothetical protein [Anaerolineales bacterium HSG24]